MKKWIAVLLAVMTLVSLAACSNTEEKKEEKIPAPVVEGAMTYEEYMAAEVDTKVTVACCVQGHQGQKTFRYGYFSLCNSDIVCLRYVIAVCVNNDYT